MNELFESGRALIIGVCAYKKLRVLPSSVLNDVSDIAATLTDTTTCGYPPVNVQTLTDCEATKQNIVAALAGLAKQSQTNDTVVVYFSGHGGRVVENGIDSSFLCPVDFDPRAPAQSGLSASELADLLKAIPSRRLAVLLDACHSAGAGTIKGDLESTEFKSGIGRDDLKRLESGTGRVILASSTESETSFVLTSARNSVFTQCVLEGLRGQALVRGDQLIRVLDLFTYVSEEVPKLAAQHPVLLANTQDNFPIALHKGNQKSSTSGKAAIDASPVTLEKILSGLYPEGPLQLEFWSRAGGDVALLRPNQPGRAAWHAAIKLVSQGGGGRDISLQSIVETAREDFPNNAELLKN